MAILIGLAAWARIARPTGALSPGRAHELMAVEFPDDPVDELWISADARGAVARSGREALILYQAGDGYVARHLPWDAALAAPVRSGQVRFRLGDWAAPTAKLAVSGITPWPPRDYVEVAGA